MWKVFSTRAPAPHFHDMEKSFHDMEAPGGHYCQVFVNSLARISPKNFLVIRQGNLPGQQKGQAPFQSACPYVLPATGLVDTT